MFVHVALMCVDVCVCVERCMVCTWWVYMRVYGYVFVCSWVCVCVCVVVVGVCVWVHCADKLYPMFVYKRLPVVNIFVKPFEFIHNV